MINFISAGLNWLMSSFALPSTCGWRVWGGICCSTRPTLRRKSFPGARNSRGQGRLGRERPGHSPAPRLEHPQLCSATRSREIFIGLGGKTPRGFAAQAGEGDGMLGAGAWEGQDGAGAHQELPLLRKWGALRLGGKAAGFFPWSNNSFRVPVVFL